MAKRSAGLLMYRLRDGRCEVLLAHPGGPFWVNKEAGAWSIPKGECEREEPLATAQREFNEETGFDSHPPFLPLGEVRQSGGKTVQGWAFEGDADPAKSVSNSFEMEWPPKSGRMRSFVEVDRVDWFDIDSARPRLIPAQMPFLDRLLEALKAKGD